MTVNAASGDLVIDENFSSAFQCSAEITPPAVVLKQGGFNDKGTLKVTGNGETNQYFAFFKDITVKPGDNYGFSCHFKTIGDLPSSSIAVFLFFNDKNKKTAGEQKIILQQTKTWEFVSADITVPANADSMRIALRLIQVPPAGTVYFSNIKLADLNSNKDFFMTDFKTDFELWDDSQRLFEHFSLGAGGKILKDAKQAKGGEAYFMANGNNAPMQYPFCIYRIKVDGKKNYVFEADYKNSKGIVSNENAMVMLDFKDKNNNILRSDYIFVAGSMEEWKNTKQTVIAPEGAIFLDICLNLRSVSPSETLYMDNIRFAPEGTR
jgi:hypothetical protein